jgi:sugar/nucleoside kinase (ribokinase family)
MAGDTITISGTGCALADFLYTNTRFNSSAFTRYLSRETGDGGLSPGRLVFTEELENFSGRPYTEILPDLTGGVPPDTFNVGGPGLVSLINTAQLLDKPGFRVRFHGSLGRDKAADMILGKIAKTPLDVTNYLKNSNKPTPFTDVLSDPTYDNGNGERTFVNNIGAAWDYLPEMIPDDFFNSRITCFGGTALVPNLHDDLSRLLGKAKERGSLTVVNTVYDFRNEKKSPGKPWPLGSGDQSFPLIDVLIMDREESLKISGSVSTDDAAAYFIARKAPCFIITNGANDILVYSGGNLFEKTGPSLFPVSRAVTELMRRDGDTTGCGDNFAGGFIASMARQLKAGTSSTMNIREAIALAVASGGFATSYKGGAYFESSAGEKWSRIRELYTDYLIQTSKA